MRIIPLDCRVTAPLLVATDNHKPNVVTFLRPNMKPVDMIRKDRLFALIVCLQLSQRMWHAIPER